MRCADLAVFDLDDLVPAADADRSWWRAQIDAHVLRAVEEQTAGRDTVLAGWTTIDEIVAAPSSPRLDGFAACLLDCDDDVRVQRVEQRAGSGRWRLHTRDEVTGFLDAAAQMRRAAEGYFRLDSSGLNVAAVADRLEQWMRLEKYAEWVLRPRLPDRPVQPHMSYFVCGTPRSGSWLLCGLLASTGVAGRPHEWFWRETEEANRRAWAVSSFADYLVRVRGAGTTPNGVFGSKLMWAYLDDFLTQLSQLADASSQRSLTARHFPMPRFVWVRRDDVVAQAVSWAKAIQTGSWHHWDRRKPATAPVYDQAQIDALARDAAAHDAGWRAWFAANEIEPLVIRFEDLVADTVGAARAVLDFIGVAAGDAPIAELTVKGSDPLNEEWAARYGASAGA